MFTAHVGNVKLFLSVRDTQILLTDLFDSRLQQFDSLLAEEAECERSISEWLKGRMEVEFQRLEYLIDWTDARIYELYCGVPGRAYDFRRGRECVEEMVVCKQENMRWHLLEVEKLLETVRGGGGCGEVVGFG